MAIRGIGIAAALAFATLVAVPAQAATYLVDFLNPTSTAAGDANGNGNSKTYVVGSGNSALSVRATGWSINTQPSTDIVTNAILNIYSGSGFGVDNRDEPSPSPDHSIDNDVGSSGYPWIDFVLLQFSRDVDLDQVRIGWAQTDSDITIRGGDLGIAWNATPALHNATVNTLNALMPFSETTDSAGAQTGYRSVNSGNYLADTWIVSARSPTNGTSDYFKLLSVSVSTPPGGNFPNVPEPSTWMMMLLGFGAIGWGMRRRRSNDAAGNEAQALA